MTCVHFWLTDSKGFGRCKRCGKTKQFKGYDYPVIDMRKIIEITDRSVFIDPTLYGKTHVRVR